MHEQRKLLDQTFREAPHSIEAEQALLGGLLRQPALLDRIPRLQAEDFFEGVHGALFTAMIGQWQTMKTFSAGTLAGVVAGFPRITKEITANDYVFKLSQAGEPNNVEALAKLVADYAQRRVLCELALSIDAGGREPQAAVAAVAEAGVERLHDVLRNSKGRRKTNFTSDEAARNLLDNIANSNHSDRITTGLPALDAAIGSWRRKQFAVLAGRPGMGKTAVALSAMLRTAKAGHGVMYFSLEMPADALTARCLSDLSWSTNTHIAYSHIIDHQLNEHDDQALGRAAVDFADLPLAIDDERGITVAELTARVRAQAAKFEKNGKRLGLVIVDHLGLLKPSGRYAGNKVHEVGEVSDALATLAKELDVAVLALHQLNRGTEGRENKQPQLADLRDSGNLEQDADVVFFAYRHSYYLERLKFDDLVAEQKRKADLSGCRHTLELIVAKNRNGPTSSVNFYCDMACNVVRDAAE